MFGYVLRRLIYTIPVIVGVVVFTFAILHITPGDPAVIVAGPDASPETLERIRANLGLDRPVTEQFFTYVGNLLQGDFGRSIISRRSVLGEITAYFPATIELVGVTMIFSVFIGVPLGILAALNRGKVLDSVFMTIALIGLTMPIFAIGLALMWLFGFTWQILPIGGRPGTIFEIGMRNLWLPMITLGMATMGVLARLTRTTMLEVLDAEYMRTAKAKGLSRFTVIVKHALKNASLPVITVMGLQFGSLLGGAVVTETVFNWPGVGRMLIQSILRKDFPVVQGVVLILALSFVGINLVVDLIYAYLNPRIQYS